jgi:hypothetical protein
VPAGSYTNVTIPTPVLTIESETTQLTEHIANQLLLSNNDYARESLRKYLEELAEVRNSGRSDVWFDQALYAVHMSWLAWITDNGRTPWNFNKLDARHITLSVVEELRSTLTSVRRRCQEGISSDLGQTLSVIESLGDRVSHAVFVLREQQKAEQDEEARLQADRREEEARSQNQQHQ